MSILRIDSVRFNGYDVTAVGVDSANIDSAADGGEVLDDWGSEGEREQGESNSTDEHGIVYGRVREVRVRCGSKPFAESDFDGVGFGGGMGLIPRQRASEGVI